MLKQFDEIIVFRCREKYPGLVLGAEGDLFWLWVADLKEVFRGHLCQVFDLQGAKYLYAEEWSDNVKDMFDANGQFISDAFWHSQNPQPLINLLKTHLLLSPSNR